MKRGRYRIGVGGRIAPNRRMKNMTKRMRAGILAAAMTAVGIHRGIAQTTTKESNVTREAKGSFDVKLSPQSAYNSAMGRMSIDKQFSGDLDATSVGEMTSFMTSVKGSAGYVAMEVVT